MPLYEYDCQDCGMQFDALRQIKDADHPIACVRCESWDTHRKLSVFNAQSGGKILAGANGCDCGNCSGGSCSGCGCTH